MKLDYEKCREIAATRFADVITAINKADNEELLALMISGMTTEEEIAIPVDDKNAVYKIEKDGTASFVYKGIEFQVMELRNTNPVTENIAYLDLVGKYLRSDIQVVTCIRINDFDGSAYTDLVPGYMYGCEHTENEQVDGMFLDYCDKYIENVGLDTLKKEQETYFANNK